MGRLFALLIAAAMTVVECIDASAKIPSLDVQEMGPAPRQWERYGAYYIADDLIISVNAANNPGQGQAEFTVFKKIKVLGSQGSKGDTVPVRHYTDHLALFECVVLDSAGNWLPLEASALRSQYEECGKVIVPKAASGSTIILRMVFTQSYAPAVYEHWFTQSIPVRTGRLVVHTDEGVRFTYGHSVYGSRLMPSESAPEQYGGHTTCWQVDNLEPAGDLPYSPRVSESEPRVGLRINPLYGTHGNVITQWGEMADLINHLLVDPAIDNEEDEIAAKAAEITKGKRNNRTRAVAIVEWVQHNITCSPEPSAAKAGAADLLRGAKSDMIAVSVLCRQLLKSAGISSHLILTRAHSRGGFDPDMLTYAGCREGFLVVKFDTVEYAVAPACAGYPVGTYPADYFGLSGLNMVSRKPVRLPAPRWDRYDERGRVTLSLSSDTAAQTICRSFSAQSMPPVRRMLLDRSETQQREAVERLLHRSAGRDSLISFSIIGLGDYDPAVVVTGRFRGNNPPVGSTGTQRFDVSLFLTGLYADIDSARRDDIVISVPVTTIDTLEIMKEKGRQVSLEASARQFGDSLFSVRTRLEQTPSAMLFIRDVETHRCIIPRQKIAAIINDIRELDKASRVVAVVKPSGKRR